MYTILDLYKNLSAGGHLLPTNTNMDFWEAVYETQTSVMDSEFTRRFASFKYFDFLDADTKSDATSDLQADILSILTFNKKRYEEMYRVFLVEDVDDPITYNYDMTETTGAQHTETEYGATSATKGQETFTKGQQQNTKGEQENTKGEQENTKGAQENTEGAVTNSHNVAPMNSVVAQLESSDAKTAQTFNDGERTDTEGSRTDTEGERVDTEGQRLDTFGSRTDTTNAHTDQFDSDEWTLTRKGNIGVQTAGDILRIHSTYWSEQYKFIQLIFDDIAKQILMIGD